MPRGVREPEEGPGGGACDAIPRPEQPLYLLDTDTSAEGAGTVLSQMKDEEEHVVVYYSAKFNPAERN